MVSLGRSVQQRASLLLWHARVSDPRGFMASGRPPTPSLIQGLSREEHLSAGWWEPAGLTWLAEGSHCPAPTGHRKHP